MIEDRDKKRGGDFVDIDRNLELFQELVRCGSEIYTWRYDGEGRLLSSNCPEEPVFDTAFTALGCRERMLAHAANGRPVMLGSPVGLVWGAAFDHREGRLYRAYVLGPVFFSDISIKQIRSWLAGDQTLTDIGWKSRFIDRLSQIPMSQHLIFAQYLLMLHYCVKEERLTTADLTVNRPDLSPVSDPSEAAIHRDRHRIWSSEQALLHMVRNGDLDYQAALHASAMLSNGVHLQGSAPLRQKKDSGIVFCSIVCRAAIEGGLSPEEGYSLGDAYIQSMEDADSLDELGSITVQMYDDFIRRVHRCRTNPKLSAAVQKCCDYIEMNLIRPIHAADLADLVGYSEYYITKKFRRETGFSINDYVKFAKVERAKALLRDPELSVLDISEQLGFSTQSYFGQVFKEITGMSPGQYRQDLAQ